MAVWLRIKRPSIAPPGPRHQKNRGVTPRDTTNFNAAPSFDAVEGLALSSLAETSNRSFENTLNP